jgi:hypothetical protein
LLAVLSACTLTDSLNAVDTTPTYEGAPVVRIASPLPEEVYAQGTSVNILARIENAGADIATLDIFIDDTLIGSATQPNAGGASAFTLTNSWQAKDAGARTVRVRAVRADGTTQGEASVVISVFAPATPTPQATATQEATTPPTATPTQDVALPPTATPTQESAPVAQATATNTPPEPAVDTTPRVRVLQGANVRSGPGLVFNPPIGNLPADATANAIGISPDRQWYKIQFGAGTGWISAQVVEALGNVATLPVDAGPPPPAPTNTPVPAVPTNTPAPATSADLSVVLITTAPNPPVCLQPFTVTARVVNTGDANSGEAVVTFVDTYNGVDGVAASAVVRGLAPNESADVSVTLTVSTNFAETHIIRVVADSDNRVPESNEGNNTNTLTYILATGGC